MKRRRLVLLALAALLVMAFPALGRAQEIAIVKIGFPFIAEGKAMPAGEYELQLNNDRSAFVLSAAPKGTGVFLTTLTRLAAPEPAGGDMRLVFDKVGDKLFLSEVWQPGEDGYLVFAAKEKHTHQMIKGQKKGR